MKTNLLLSIVIGTTLVVGCRTAQNKTAGFYSYKTECLGSEMDGSQTVKTWGDGRNRVDAIEQAKKNGVRDVIFKGISEGKAGCDIKPLVSEVNAQEKYEMYFNKFFADGGPYKDFITFEDGNDAHIEVLTSRQKAGSQETYRVIIRIQKAKLKQQLIKDGILQ